MLPLIFKVSVIYEIKIFVACAQCMRTANDADFLELNSSKYI